MFVSLSAKFFLFFFAVHLPALFPVKRQQSPSWTTSAACLTTWQTNWMQCWTDLLPVSHFQQSPLPSLSPIMCRCMKKTLPRLDDAGAQTVCALVCLSVCLSCVSASHVALYSILRRESPSSGAVALVRLPMRGGRSHTTSDLCSPASHRHPASDRLRASRSTIISPILLSLRTLTEILTRSDRETDR